MVSRKRLLRYLAWYLISLAISAVLIMMGAWAVVAFTANTFGGVIRYDFHSGLIVSYLLVAISLLGIFAASIGKGIRIFATSRLAGKWTNPEIMREGIKELQEEEDEQEKSSGIGIILGLAGFTLLGMFFVIFR